MSRLHCRRHLLPCPARRQTEANIPHIPLSSSLEGSSNVFACETDYRRHQIVKEEVTMINRVEVRTWASARSQTNGIFGTFLLSTSSSLSTYGSVSWLKLHFCSSHRAPPAISYFQRDLMTDSKFSAIPPRVTSPDINAVVFTIPAQKLRSWPTLTPVDGEYESVSNPDIVLTAETIVPKCCGAIISCTVANFSSGTAFHT